MTCTKVESTSENGKVLLINPKCMYPDRHPGQCVINGFEYPRADVVAALDAVPRSELVGAEQTERANYESARKFYARAEIAEAKLTEMREQYDAAVEAAHRASDDHLAATEALAALTAERDAEYRKYAQEADRAEELENRLAAVTAEAKLADSMPKAEFHRMLEARETVNAQLVAERDAHAATIERVREWAVDYFGALGEAPDELRAALAPKPAFVLPTKAGAGIMVIMVHNGIDHELRLYSDGLWSARQIDFGYTPEQVMEHFTDHRLIEQEGGGE